MHKVEHIFFCLSVYVLSHFSHVQLFVTLWTVSRQAPLTMGLSRQEYWNGLLCPPPGELPDTGIKPTRLTFPALAGGFFTTSATWDAILNLCMCAKSLQSYPALKPYGL